MATQLPPATSLGSVPTPTRRIAGPLTTTFTPIDRCYTPLLDGWDAQHQTPSVYGWGQGCNSALNTYCFPPNAEKCATCSTPDGLLAVYTPAIGCPSGWTSACGASRIDEKSAIGDAFVTNWLEVGEAMQVCCPSGWQCNFSSYFGASQGGVMSCITSYTASSSALSGLSCATFLGDGSAFSLTEYMVTSPTASLFGSVLPIALLAVDSRTTSSQATSSTPVSQQTAESATQSQSPSQPQPQSQSPSQSQSQSLPVAQLPPSNTPTVSAQDPGGLSTGAKVGIGVGVGAGVLLIVAIIALLWSIRIRQRGHSYPSSTWSDSMTLGEKIMPPEAIRTEGARRAPTELENTRGPVELEDTQNTVTSPTIAHLREAREARMRGEGASRIS